MEPAEAPTRRQIRRWRRYLAEERMEAATYRNLAKRLSGVQRDIMLELAEAERRHEEHWLRLLGPRAEPAPRPPLLSRITGALAGKFGSVFVLALAQRSEQRTAYDFDRDASTQMAADEHIHGEVVRSLAAESRAQMAGSFRAAVFGANDGLISNLALILGVAAAGISSPFVLATGFAGLLAGALSMGAGEWISVSSQRELLSASLPDQDAHRSLPSLDVNANELALLYRARGETEEEALAHARRTFSSMGEEARGEDTEITLRATFDDDADRSAVPDVVGSPWQAAISSFGFFALGAALPLLPFLWGGSTQTLMIVSVLLVGAALLGTGGIVGLLSGGSTFRAALRQLLIGYGAAAITYALGSAFGVALG